MKFGFGSMKGSDGGTLPEHLFRVALVGDKGVGKSSLINKFTGDPQVLYQNNKRVY